MKKKITLLIAILTICLGCFSFGACQQLNTVTTTPSDDLELGTVSTHAVVKGLGDCLDTDIIIPSTYSGKPVEIIGQDAFKGCSEITSVTIPDSVKTIGDGAFSGCSGLTKVIIPTSVKTIGATAFYGCRNLTSITIPNGVTTIGKNAFTGCSNLVDLKIPGSLKKIEENAFYNCNKLQYNIKNGLKYLGNSENQYVVLVDAESEVTTAEIADDCKFILEGAFKDCSDLTSVTIANSVIFIGAGAFEGCNNLGSITIPENVETIDKGVFKDCENLTSIAFDDCITWRITDSKINWESKSGGEIVFVSKSENNVALFNDTYAEYYWYKTN